MTNRKLAYIITEQKPLVLAEDQTVRHACEGMWQRRTGSVLVADGQQRLTGIFTARDAVRVLAERKDAAVLPLAEAMTPNPVAITPQGRAIDALRAMNDGGFRHVPVTDGRRIWGVVSRGDFKGMEFEEFAWNRVGKAHGIASNRELGLIIKDQPPPLLLGEDDTVHDACGAMWNRRTGSVLVVDDHQRLSGIFTGRDLVRALAKNKAAATKPLAKEMTADPVTMTPKDHAIDALRAMSEGGFRHLPVTQHGRILGIVSRGDFTGIEFDRLEEEEHLWECIR